jgi:hypothetical protein
VFRGWLLEPRMTASKAELRVISAASVVFNVGSVFEPSVLAALMWMLIGLTLLVWFFLVPVEP